MNPTKARQLPKLRRDASAGVCEFDLIHPEAVARAREAMPEPAVIQQVAAIFHVLSNPTRAGIVHALARVELCVCDVAAVAGLSISAASHQLMRLRDQGVVTCRKDGRLAFYRLSDDHLRGLIEEGIRHVQE